MPLNVSLSISLAFTHLTGLVVIRGAVVWPI
jgi:hypothetical protein